VIVQAIKVAAGAALIFIAEELLSEFEQGEEGQPVRGLAARRGAQQARANVSSKGRTKRRS